MLTRTILSRTALGPVRFASTQVASAMRAAKEEGSIASVFGSLRGEEIAVLPQRFSDLKKDLWKEGLMESWREVLAELKGAVEETVELGSEIISKIEYSELEKGTLSEGLLQRVRKTGTVVVQGGVSEEEALGWKQSIKDYVAANRPLVKGFPADDIQVFELYHSKAQTAARSHPALLNTQRYLLSLWHTSDPNTPISLNTPISYYDRLRIRHPGDSQFALGPHVDGGSLERWEDPGFRSCWKHILEGGSSWRSHDPFDASPRLGSVQDLYNGPGQCSVFRPWQGWTALSHTGPSEGTLRVLPFVHLATAYIILRPFFRPRRSLEHLSFADWELDLECTSFPGSAMGRCQELSHATHPHLQLEKTMTSAPVVRPGDQVYWHCDVVHAVETEHRGQGDSSVLYIPAIPLTLNNAAYLAHQRSDFLKGVPPSDFPGGEGESSFVGRATAEDVVGVDARRALGLERFVVPEGATPGAKTTVEGANAILF